ncbi:MAG: hypothetical protein MRY83_03790, partial [Flavobacteriales bacterium]|nr:hypothetical protein [Flavobacteriales bacterium]
MARSIAFFLSSLLAARCSFLFFRCEGNTKKASIRENPRQAITAKAISFICSISSIKNTNQLDEDAKVEAERLQELP